MLQQTERAHFKGKVKHDMHTIDVNKQTEFNFVSFTCPSLTQTSDVSKTGKEKKIVYTYSLSLKIGITNSHTFLY